MSNTEKIKALKLEVSRLEKAQKSEFVRHIDIANLMDARDKLKALELEARLTISDKPSSKS